MSYSRGLGQAASTVTCKDGRTISVPAGQDANALCLSTHMALTRTVTCKDGRTIQVMAGQDPNAACIASHPSSGGAATIGSHTVQDIATIAAATGQSIAAVIAALNPPASATTTPATDPTLTTLPPTIDMSPPPSRLPTWLVPAVIGGGVLLIGGLFVLGRRKHHTVTTTVAANPRPHGYSRATIGKIIAHERRRGKSQSVASAIAYREARAAARRAGVRPAYLRRQR